MPPKQVSPSEKFSGEFNRSYARDERKMLHVLSKDSRIIDSRLGKLCGLRRQMVAPHRRMLERKLALQYTVELEEEKLGLTSPHIILLKFRSEPDPAEIKRILISEYSWIPQVIATVKGSFDMFVFANATSKKDYVHWDRTTQSLLADYEVDWQASEVLHRNLGFFPLTQELIRKLDIEPEFKNLLELLNANSSETFAELSKALGKPQTTIGHRIHRMHQDIGYIKRFTTIIHKFEMVGREQHADDWGSVRSPVLMVYFSKYVVTKNFEVDAEKEREKLMSDDKEDPAMSRYQVVMQTLGNYDTFTLGVFDDIGTAHERDINFVRRALKREIVRLEYGVVDKVLLGALPLRNLKTKDEYSVLPWKTRVG